MGITDHRGAVSNRPRSQVLTQIDKRRFGPGAAPHFLFKAPGSHLFASRLACSCPSLLNPCPRSAWLSHSLHPPHPQSFSTTPRAAVKGIPGGTRIWRCLRTRFTTTQLHLASRARVGRERGTLQTLYDPTSADCQSCKSAFSLSRPMRIPLFFIVRPNPSRRRRITKTRRQVGRDTGELRTVARTLWIGLGR